MGAVEDLRPKALTKAIGDEAAALEDLVAEAEPLAVPVEQLQPVAPPPAEREDGAPGRVLAKGVLRQSGQTRGPLAHVRYPQRLLKKALTWRDLS